MSLASAEPRVLVNRSAESAPRSPNRSGGAVVRRLLRWSSPLILLALWQLSLTTGLISESTLPSPATVWEATRQLWASGELQDAIAVSVGRALKGFALGAVVAIAVATVVGLSKWGEALLDPPMQMLRMLPLFGLVPLFIIWFGIKEEPKIYLVALFSLVPLFLNLVAALRSVDHDLVEVARVHRLRPVEKLRRLYVPAVLPGFLVGLRQSLGAALVALVVAEQVNASAGLGYLINRARDVLRIDVIIVCLLCYAVLGLVTDAAVRFLERWAVRWRPVGSPS